MYCKKCGEKIDGNYCSNCGYNNNEENNNNVQVQESGAIGWGILGFLIPIVGLILFIVWRQTKPKSSKAAGIGALISVILSIILTIIMFAVLGSVISNTPTIYTY